MSKEKQGDWLAEIAASRKNRKQYDQKRFDYSQDVSKVKTEADTKPKFNDPRGAGYSKPDVNIKNLNGTTDHGATRAELKKLANKSKGKK